MEGWALCAALILISEWSSSGVWEGILSSAGLVFFSLANAGTLLKIQNGMRPLRQSFRNTVCKAAGSSLAMHSRPPR